MPVTKFLQALPHLELDKYGKSKKKIDDAIGFTGSARKHPYDPEKILVICRPFSSDTEFFEFRLEDVVFAELLPQITSDEGQILNMAKIWIKKQSVGLRYEPFTVDDDISFMTPDKSQFSSESMKKY